jgi:hypothetical protein
MSLRVVPLEGEAVARAWTVAAVEGVAAHHHPCWIDVLRVAGEDVRGVAAFEGDALAGWLLYCVRRAACGAVATSLPYLAYGGPSTSRAAVVDVLIHEFVSAAASLGIDAVTIGLGPSATAMEIDAIQKSLRPTHEAMLCAQVQRLDVHPLDAISRKRRQAIRSEALRAPRAGLRCDRDLDPDHYEQWINVYQSRMVEIGVTGLPSEYLRAVRDIACPAGVAEFWSVLEGARVIGGIVFLTSRTTVDYYLSAFRSEARDLFPNTCLLLRAIDEFRSRGVALLNWQGSGGNEGVRSFKARWGAEEASYRYLCRVLRENGPLLHAPLSEVRQAFPYRFVLPYSVWPTTPTSA